MEKLGKRGKTSITALENSEKSKNKPSAIKSVKKRNGGGKTCAVASDKFDENKDRPSDTKNVEKPRRRRKICAVVLGKSEESKDKLDTAKSIKKPGSKKETCAVVSDKSEKTESKTSTGWVAVGEHARRSRFEKKPDTTWDFGASNNRKRMLIVKPNKDGIGRSRFSIWKMCEIPGLF